MHHSPAFLALVEETLPRIREISVQQLREWRLQEIAFILLDVREDHEWEQGNIPGAEHLGRGILERDVEERVPEKDARIVLYCGGGYRSALAADNLQKMGYANIFSLAGGYRAWCIT